MRTLLFSVSHTTSYCSLILRRSDSVPHSLSVGDRVGPSENQANTVARCYCYFMRNTRSKLFLFHARTIIYLVFSPGGLAIN